MHIQNILTFIFAINISLLFIHEMEAIRYKEWRMFIILKDMDDNKAYQIFLLAHIPLYVLILFILFLPIKKIGFYITDVFLILHLIIHIFFIKHKNNKLNNFLSINIIILMGLLSILHLLGILLLV